MAGDGTRLESGRDLISPCGIVPHSLRIMERLADGWRRHQFRKLARPNKSLWDRSPPFPRSVLRPSGGLISSGLVPYRARGTGRIWRGKPTAGDGTPLLRVRDLTSPCEFDPRSLRQDTSCGTGTLGIAFRGLVRVRTAPTPTR